MNALYILKKDPELSLMEIMESHKQKANVTVIDIRQDKDYAKIVGLIESSDKIICV